MNPIEHRLSKHFLLSDFLGNHSAYTYGLPNMLDINDPQYATKLLNVQVLCHDILEPLVERFGPISISYGYINPAMSKRIVTYQSPTKPSHHQFNLGAAADICVHDWVDSDRNDDTDLTAPIALAHQIDQMGLPYSRMITYSESPFICVAASYDEIVHDCPRKAFYENRYTGTAKAKPDYKGYPTDTAKYRASEALRGPGLRPVGWRGAGYPTYHGGGRRQMHHSRVSKYCMVSDFLFDLQSIAKGAKNVPNMQDDAQWNLFCEAGEAYDAIIDATGVRRMSIIEGYVHPSNPSSAPHNDWRNHWSFAAVLPEETPQEDIDKITAMGHVYDPAEGTVWVEKKMKPRSAA